MPIALRGSAAVPAGNPTTGFTITIPATQAGDWCEFVFTSRDHTAITGLPTVTDNDTGGNTWTVSALSLDRKALVARKRATSGTAGKTITVAGCVGSSSGVLKCWSGTDTVASPVTNEVVETNLSGDEAHAGFTPTNADSMVCAAVFNYANDNAVTSLSFATLGATTMTEKLSTGGSDCATAFGHALQSGGPSATGGLSWAQTNGTTYSATWALKPLVSEQHSGSATLTSGGGITPTSSTQRTAAPAMASGGGVTLASTTARSIAPTLSAGGGITPANSTTRTAVSVLAAGGGINPVSTTSRAAATSLSGGGGFVPASATQRASGQLLAAGGGIGSAGSTQRVVLPILTGGGLILAEGLAEEGGAEAHSGTAVLTAGGLVALVVRTARALVAALTGGGAIAGVVATARAGSAALAAGGGITCAGYNSTPIEYQPLDAQAPSVPRTFAAAEAPAARADVSTGFGQAFPDG